MSTETEARNREQLPEVTPEEFLARIHRSCLIDGPRRDALVARFRERNPGRKLTWQHLAELFVRGGLLTHWQVRRLLHNKLDRFFIGRYKLLDHLGSGGMGAVFLAEHTKMNRKVALKILPQQLVENKVYLDAFYRESEALAGLDHPSIVRAYDVNSEGQIHYLAMEYVEGENLEKLAKGGQMPFEAAA
jgi:serine/threonine-protein kinase